MAGVGGASLGQLAWRYVLEREKQHQFDKRTALNVRNVLTKMVDQLPDRPKAVKRRHLEKWMESMEYLAAGTRRLRFSMARTFFQWCVDNRYLPQSPMAGMVTPFVPAGMPKRLRADEARAVVQAAAGPDPRRPLVVSLMLQEALRRVEISRLVVEDIDFAERTILVRGKGSQGEHDAALSLTAETWNVLLRYLAETGINRGPLIQNSRRPGRGVSADWIAQMVTEAMIDAGVKRRGDRLKTPHSCRHTAAHDMLTNTRDVRAVQKALRHKTVSSTEIYLRGHVSDLRGIMDGRSYSSTDSATVDQLPLPFVAT